jgi:hypothetical protein
VGIRPNDFIIYYVSAYIGNVLLEDVTDNDLEGITESLEGMNIAGLIDMEFIKEIHGGNEKNE